MCEFSALVISLPLSIAFLLQRGRQLFPDYNRGYATAWRSCDSAANTLTI